MKVSEEETEKRFPVPMRLWETPVPIPNTMVKPQAADNTILETVWEDRWVPGAKKQQRELIEDRTGRGEPPGLPTWTSREGLL